MTSKTGERTGRALRVTLELSASPADTQVVLDGLRAFNVEVIGQPNIQPVTLFVRDESGTVLGGLISEIKWRWLYIAKLWIADALRGQGFGRQLMEQVEEHAWREGCLGIHVDTFEYQALPFYQKLGYEVFGVLDGFPPGYKKFYLKKYRAD